MRVAKTESLKKEMKIYQQNHERVVDCKEAIIQMLDRDLEEAETQYAMALRNHKIRVDQLISLQDSRLRGLKEEYIRDLTILKNEYDKEKAEIEQSHNMERRELQDMIETFDEEAKRRQDELQSQFDRTKEEIKNENVEELEIMKHDLIKKIEELDKNFEISFNRYVSETQTKSNEYIELLGKNKKNTIDITTTIRKTK